MTREEAREKPVRQVVKAWAVFIDGKFTVYDVFERKKYALRFGCDVRRVEIREVEK